MDSNPASSYPGGSLEGQRFQLVDPQERHRVIDLAFDYRGDITLELESGECIEGYLFDRDLNHSVPTIKIFPKGQTSTQTIQCEHLAALVFSGEDTAFGKSWDEWINKMKKVSQKKQSS